MGCFGGGKSNSSGGCDGKFGVLSARWDIGTDPIGEGGFGSVHLATNRKTGKVRALKAMRLKAPEEWEDFHNEILVMNKIKRHRNICHILDTAEDKKFGYIVMQVRSAPCAIEPVTVWHGD